MKAKILLAAIIIFCSSVVVFAQLNLSFNSRIAISSDPVRAGDNVTFTVRFLAGGAAVDNFKIIGGVDGTRIVDRTFAHLNLDGSRSQSMNWEATAGSHTVWFEIDPDHATRDIDYSNNRIEITLNVDPTIASPVRSSSELGNMTVVDSPGLSVSLDTSRKIVPADPCKKYESATADLELDFLTFNRVSLRNDDPIEYRYEVRIKNNSNKCITRLKFKLVDQGGALIKEVSPLASKSKYLIKSMETKSWSNVIGIDDITNFNICNFGIGRQFMCCTITAIVDPDNEIPESNEGNNSKTIGPLYWNEIED
jgi:hypothetical protein